MAIFFTVRPGVLLKAPVRIARDQAIQTRASVEAHCAVERKILEEIELAIPYCQVRPLLQPREASALMMQTSWMVRRVSDRSPLSARQRQESAVLGRPAAPKNHTGPPSGMVAADHCGRVAHL